ncbi:MAG: DUF6352 family protein [Pseudomonadota bacterium]
MPDFWQSSGYHLLERDAAGRLSVTDDFLRAYYLRPELRPVEESCAAERSLHEALMLDPRRPVAEAEIATIADPDARDNWRVMLRFRERLLAAGTLQGCYATLFAGEKVDIPPLFVDQMAHVILRSILADCGDPLMLRAGELFYREQKAAVKDGEILLADLETVQMHASGMRYGSLGRLIVETQGTLAAAQLEVLDRANAALYWDRHSRHDTAISLNYGRPALAALARVIERWVAHFLGVAVAVTPLARIEEPRWVWHVGLDAESTAILNDLWHGVEVEAGRMRRLLALFRLDFADPAAMRAELAGRPVYAALASDAEDVVRMKPQNLLVNLPLAARS